MHIAQAHRRLHRVLRCIQRRQNRPHQHRAKGNAHQQFRKSEASRFEIGSIFHPHTTPGWDTNRTGQQGFVRTPACKVVTIFTRREQSKTSFRKPGNARSQQSQIDNLILHGLVSGSYCCEVEMSGANHQ
jgi:hypothetical protein